VGQTLYQSRKATLECGSIPLLLKVEGINPDHGWVDIACFHEAGMADLFHLHEEDHQMNVVVFYPTRSNHFLAQVNLNIRP